MANNIHLNHSTFSVHNCVVVVVLAIFVVAFVAFVAWLVFLALAHDSTRNGLRLLGPPWNSRFWGHNADSTFPIWWTELH